MRHNVLRRKEINEYIGLLDEINCYHISSTASLTFTNDYFADKTVTNEGTASVTKYDNYIEFGAGTIFGIKIYSGAILVNELPCVENNIEVPYLHCLISGERFFISGAKILSTQNTYTEVQKYGFQFITDNTKEIIVPLKTDKTKIYN